MRYVIIGSGNISDTYAQAIPGIGSEVVGVVSRSGHSPASRLDLPSWRALGDVEAAFDAVCVATPNGLPQPGRLYLVIR